MKGFCFFSRGGKIRTCDLLLPKKSMLPYRCLWMFINALLVNNLQNFLSLLFSNFIDFWAKCCTYVVPKTQKMASTKLILRTSKTLKNGEHPIVLRVIKDRKSKFIFTGYSCPANLWDFKENKPKKKHPNRLELELFLDKKKAEAQKIILDLENENANYTPESFKQVYKVSTKKITVFKFLDEIIENLQKQNRVGNANMYKDCKRSLMKFRNNVDLYFNDITVSFLLKYERHLAERGVTGNSISVYMRTIRSAFNKAIAEKYIKRDTYPFEDYKISKLDTGTQKRALTKAQMQQIINLEILEWNSLKDAKNYFLFSYYCRGINFTDMAFLQWKDISNNRLTYVRAKTGKSYNMELLLPAMDILNLYHPFTGEKRDNYVFPILNKEKHITAIQKDNRITKVLKKVNDDLKEIANQAKVDIPLTTYVARHSFATILKRQGVSTSIISEALGHDNERTTQIYLDTFENSVLDEASKMILL